MELNIKEPKDEKELIEMVSNMIEIPEKIYIAVEANIFSKDKKLIYHRRGPKCKTGRFKLEGIGGRVEESDLTFRDAIKREISEEVGSKANISIKKFLYARTEIVLDLEKNINKFWIIMSYIATLEDGELKVMEKEKNLGYERYRLEEIDINELSQPAKSSYEKIKENWDKIKLII